MQGISMTYAKFYPSDWRGGCLVLNLEEEGLYIRCCAYMYDTGQHLPGDDVTASRLLNVQIQKYQKVMKALIEKGKMIRAQGWIINERVEAEWRRYQKQITIWAEAAKKREATKKRLQEEIGIAIVAKRAEQGTPPPTPLDTPPHTTPPTLDPPRDVEQEKTNEINGAEAGKRQTLADKLEARSHRSKKRSSKEDLVADATPAPDDENASEVDALTSLEAFNSYNDLAQRIGLPLARTLTPQRRKSIIRRLKEHGAEAWGIALTNIERSAFLRGQNNRNWRADLDFVLQTKSFTRLVEGGYGNGAHADAETAGESQEERWARIISETADKEARQ